VEPLPGRNALVVELATSLVPALPAILSRLRQLFDLDARPDVIACHLQGDARLASLVARCPGLRVPGAFDAFELVVRAILGQRVSVKAATTLAGRLAQALSEPVVLPFPCLTRLPVAAERLADASPAQLTELGIASPRAAALRGIARAVADGEVDLVPGADPEAVIGALAEYPGIGDWTAQYVALRALRWPDAFPAGDLGLLRAWGAGSGRALREAAKAWRPWRAYAALHLWESLYVDEHEEHHE
jgi:AraC family transcriptional regulator of adaptative response / DNA-3-methyladenine glycosylase II